MGHTLLLPREASCRSTTAPSGDANGGWRAALQPRQMRPRARMSRTHLCLCRGETALYKQRKTNQAFEFEHLPLTLWQRAGGGWTRIDSRAQGDGKSPTQEFEACIEDLLL